MVALLTMLWIFPAVSATRTFAPSVEAKTGLGQSVKQETKVQSVNDLVTLYSLKYGVSSSVMLRIMECENKSRDPKGQSKHIYYFSDPKRNIVEGTRERSFGLVQIHLPDHPDVTYEQATDPLFAIEFLARELSKGHGYWWTCY